jgi:hypothetical protein
MLNIHIGFDPREEIAYEVLAYSIRRRASVPVTISPIKRQDLKDLYTRARGPTESTDFSLTRFLVPRLSDFRGWSVYMDCDMLCRTDIAGLEGEIKRHADKALLVAKHEYTPISALKMKGMGSPQGKAQTVYPRKNWSSLMIFNNQRCTALTPEYVNSASGLMLHRFEWTADELIGSLPLEWNWLVTEYQHSPAAKIAHFTLGGPWFDEYRDCDYADEWLAELEAMKSAETRRA